MPAIQVPTLLTALQEHGLLEPAQLNELGKWPEARAADLRALARKLVQQRWLTAFQINQLMQGKGKELTIGPYRLLDRLGEGAMGQVFKAHHQVMNRTVALKVIRKERLSNADAVRRFYREVQAAAQLVHPNIVLSFDAGQVGNTHFFAMEYIEGIDLSRLVKESGPLPVTRACDHIRQAALGLEHAHARNLVHRDIKPSNLIVVSDQLSVAGKEKQSPQTTDHSQPTTVKILDMGLARLHGASGDPAMTRDGVVMGTPEYLAPEQALDAQSADIRSDLYSLGCTFYFLLAGRAPFQAKSLTEMLLKHQLEEPPPLEKLRPDVPAAVVAVVRKLMAKQPGDRYQTPSEVAAVLGPLSRGESGTAAGERIETARSAAPIAVDWSGIADTSNQETADQADEGKTIVTAPGSAGAPVKHLRRTPASSQRLRWIIAASAAGAAVLVAAAVTGVVWLHSQSKPTEQPTDPGDHASSGGGHDSTGTKSVSGTFRLLPVPDVALEPGETQTIEVRVERRGFKGTISVLLNGLPADVTALPATIPETAEIVQLQFTAAAHAADGQKDIQVVAAGGAQSHNGELRVSVKRAVAAKVDPAPMEPGPYRPFEGATGFITSLACSGDGRQAVSGGSDRAVRLWDIATGKELHHFDGHTGPVLAVAVSADGRHILSAGTDRTIRLWETATRKELHRFLNAHATTITSLAIAPDGRLALSAGADSVVRLWDLEGRKQSKACVGTWGAVSSVVFLPGGGQFLFAGADGTLQLRDTKSMDEVRKFERHNGRVVCLAVSEDGQLALSGGVDRTLRLWNIPSGKLVHTITENPTPATAVAFAPGGRLALSTGSDRTLRIWDLSSYKEVRRFEKFSSRVMRVAVAADGKFALTAGEGIQAWQLPELGVTSAAAARVFGGTLVPFGSVAFSKDGRKALSGSADRSVQLWDLETGKELARFEEHTDKVLSVALAPDALRGLSVSADGSLRVWDLENSKQLRRWPAPKGVFLGWVSYGTDGKYYLAGIRTKTTLIWTGEGVLKPVSKAADKEPWGEIRSLALSPDGRRMVFGTSDGIVGLWEVGRIRDVQRLKRHKEAVYCVAFSPDGKKVLSGGGNVITTGDQATALDCAVRLWDAENGKELQVFQGHAGRVTCVAFTPDGRHVLSGSQDKTVRVWNVASGREVYCFREHADAVLAVSVSPDGRRVLSAGDGLRLWAVPAVALPTGSSTATP